MNPIVIPTVDYTIQKTTNYLLSQELTTILAEEVDDIDDIEEDEGCRS